MCAFSSFHSMGAVTHRAALRGELSLSSDTGSARRHRRSGPAGRSAASERARLLVGARVHLVEHGPVHHAAPRARLALVHLGVDAARADEEERHLDYDRHDHQREPAHHRAWAVGLLVRAASVRAHSEHRPHGDDEVDANLRGAGGRAGRCRRKGHIGAPGVARASASGAQRTPIWLRYVLISAASRQAESSVTTCPTIRAYSRSA